MSSEPIRTLAVDQLERFATAARTDDGSAWERGAIPVGEQHEFLVSIAGKLRQHGLTTEGIFHALCAIGGNGTLERDPGRRPWDERDFKTIADSAGAWAYEPSFEIKRARIRYDVPIVGAPIEWWVHGFIPRAELVMLYGAKASGKSTFGSWLGSVVTQAGGTFLHIGVEEPYARFRGRALLGGAVGTRLAGWDGTLQLPTDIDDLEEVVLNEHIDLVYLDSIYSHFTAPRGTLENTRARANLEPLAKMAQRTGATVIGSFHDRRSDGSYMGSTEMINVARVVLKLTRPRGGASRLVYETGNFTEPGYALRLDAEDRPLVDTTTGATQMERQRDGTLAPHIVKVIQGVEEVPEAGTSADLAHPVDLAEHGTQMRIERSDDRCAQARELAAENWSTSDIADKLDVTRRTVERYLHGEPS